MNKDDKQALVPGGVDEYISRCPTGVKKQLEQVRDIIREIAPGAIETVSYFQIPGYSYPGYDYNGMFVWFSFKHPYVRIHVRPPVVEDHIKELESYPTTASIISFPMDEPLPTTLIKKMIKASLKVMKQGSGRNK